MVAVAVMEDEIADSQVCDEGLMAWMTQAYSSAVDL